MTDHETRGPAGDAQAVAEQTRAAAETASEAAEQSSEAARHTRHAAQTTSRAASQTAVAARATKTAAERATELAADRTVLAFERTYAAWVRTGLVALASGIGARTLLEGAVPEPLAIAAGCVLLAFSAFSFIAGVWRQLFRVDEPDPQVRRLPPALLITFNGVLALTALAALFTVMLASVPR